MHHCVVCSKSYNFHMKRILFVAFLLSGIHCYSQDSSFNYKNDSTLLRIRSQSFKSSRPFLYHLPMAIDQANIKEFGYLSDQKPTENNYKGYYKLACSLWQLNKLEEAEPLLLNIINSQEKYYTSTYRNSSDVSGDTSTNLYGYGSYTSNYKNGAALYLAKLYLQQENYKKALQCLEDAVKKYPVNYTCGTGSSYQQEEYTTLYTYCYEGLKQYSKMLDVLLPHFQTYRGEMLIPTIKRMYKPKEIESYLQKAISSMHCTFDTLPTTVVQTSNVQGKWDTVTYYSGRASINLFGRSVALYPSIRKDGERITKDDFIKSFKESRFYQQLTDTVNPLQHTTAGFVPRATHRRSLSYIILPLHLGSDDE